MTRLQYGSRGRRNNVDSGIRRVSPTFGKQLLLTSSEKSGGEVALDGIAERFVSHALELDPDAREVRPQPMTVDLTDGRILRTPQEKAEARARHKARGSEPVFYTPDFGLTWARVPTALEVSLEGYESSGQKAEKLPRAKQALSAWAIELVHVVVPSYWRHPLLTNIPSLRQASRRKDLCPAPEVADQVGTLAAEGARTLGDYCRGLDLDSRLTPVLVANGVLSVDVTKYELCFGSPAEPAFGSLDHLQVLRRLAK
jgi:hypothetical protein